MADRLAEQGWAEVAGWPEPGLTAALAARARYVAAEAANRPAQLGRQSQKRLVRTIWQARIRWLTGADPAELRFFQVAEAARLALKAQLFLGLFRFEACFAHYPMGGFYKRHVDALKGARNRVISLVTYLNEAWDSADDGALVIYAADGTEAVRLMPCAGRSVLMLSEQIEHEVRPCHADRHAIAGWWRVNDGP